MRLLYDRKWVAVYDDIVNSGYYDYLEEAKIIANIAGKRKTFLELGSGTGNLVLALVSLGKDVTGMDNSPVMNKAFEKKIKKQKLSIPLLLGDQRRMDLGKNWEVIFSAGGFIWFVTLDGKIFLHTYDKGMEGVRRSFEKVYKHLNKGGLFLVNIQHQGWNHRQPLKSGREFSFEITKKTPTRVFKHHKIHDNGSLVFERKFPLRMFSEKKADEAAENSGFKVLGPDPTNSFYVFEK